MLDFSKALTEKTDTIIERWIEQVHQGRQIASALDLSQTALRDAIPKVLGAMGTLLSISPEDDDFTTIVEASLEHGVFRARQGYNSAEIAWEYCLLRRAIFSALEPDLLQGSPQEILRAFDIINAVLDQAISQCFQSYVQERMTELEQLQGQLSLTNQELTRLLHASQDNISHLAHELKTPLNSIIGYSELLLRQQQRAVKPQEGSSDIENRINNLERVLRNGRQLLQLVNDSLELSRYKAGRMELQLVSIDVRSVINNAIETISPLAHAKGLQLEVDCDLAPSQVRTDPFRLQQILTNFLSNAVYYTEAGSIRLECLQLPGDQWSLSVTDTGVGIAPEDQVRIFEPYARIVSNSLRQPGDGTGLGLAIASQLTHLLQGKVTLVSQVGVGSTFTLLLPLEATTSGTKLADSPSVQQILR